MRLHDIQDDDLPSRIKANLDKYKKSLKKNVEVETERQKSFRGKSNNTTFCKNLIFLYHKIYFVGSIEQISSQGSLNNLKKNSRKDDKGKKDISKKSLSTGRSKKHKIDTNLSHVAVTGGDMITVRNKNKKVDIKKGLEDSLIDSMSNKSKSNTRNNERLKQDRELNKIN